MPCSTCCCDPCQYGRMLRLGQLAIAQRRTLRSHKGSCADTFDCICCCPLVELLCSIGCCCTDEFFDLGEGGKGYGATSRVYEFGDVGKMLYVHWPVPRRRRDGTS